jgi:hypothetical protein
LDLLTYVSKHNLKLLACVIGPPFKAIIRLQLCRLDVDNIPWLVGSLFLWKQERLLEELANGVCAIGTVS